MNSKQTALELGEEFQMTENALLKAKDKALGKLRVACENGRLGLWREARRMVRAVQKKCGSTNISTPQALWCLEKQREG